MRFRPSVLRPLFSMAFPLTAALVLSAVSGAALTPRQALAADPPARGLALPPYRPPEWKEPVPRTEDGGKRYGIARNVAYYQTSEVFLGRIAVAVVLPDTPGAVYTSYDIETVLSAVRGAMDFWVEQVGYIGVTFYYEVTSGVPCSRNFLTTQPRQQEAQWVGEILTNMGYPSGASDAAEIVYPYLDSLRTRLGTEWAVCFFIPKVPAFNASYISYGRIGGPFWVVPAGSVEGGNRSVLGRRLAHLIIHDTAHLFWAQNEYGEGMGDDPAPCNRRSGYFGVYNLNSAHWDYTCQGRRQDPCCMAEPNPVVCPITLAHMGLVNEDDDGVPDILDTYPVVELDSIADTITTVTPSISVRAHEEFVRNRAGDGSRNAITFNAIEHVVYRIDQMLDSLGQELWLRADPPEGIGDTTSVAFSFVPESLTAGRHRITVRAENSAGNRSDYAGEKVIDVYVKAVAIRDFKAEPDYGGEVKVSFRVRGETLGAGGALYRRTEEGGETLLGTLTLQEDGAVSLYDHGARPGERTVYRLEVSNGELAWDWETEMLGPSPIAAGRFLSIATPNPFRDRTVISFRVPRGDPIEQTTIDDDDDEIPVPPTGERAPLLGDGGRVRYAEVRVEIRIFDLAGRLVRSFPNVHSFEGFYTDPIIWDGRDQSGRPLPTGFYFVRMKAGRVTDSRKVLLLP